MSSQRTILSCAIVAAGTLLAPAVHAQQSYPAQPVRVIVPYPPGGPVDLAARALGQAMSTALGQTFVTDNRGGAGGSIGTQAGAQAAPDGYTLLHATSSTLALNPHLQKHVQFDPEKSFAPVCLYALAPLALFASNKLPVTDYAGFLAYAKQNPGRVNYGSSGVGSITHLGGEWLNQLAGINMTHVAYKGATGVTQALMSGEVEVGFAGVGGTLDLVRQKKLRILGVAGPKPLQAMPEVPVITEARTSGFDLSSWFALVAPAGTPPAAVARLNKACLDALEQKSVREAFAALALDIPDPATPAAVQKVVNDSHRHWGELIKANKITPQ